LGATERSGHRFTIITGGPGAGKTSLIDELRRRGFAGTREAGRAIIADQDLIGGRATHTGDALFAELMLALEMRSFYRPTVFVALPWPEIYTTDAERKQDYVEAVATCDAVRAAYLSHGYQPIDLPLAPVAERADFVLARR
jgi:predicted ATPase